MTLPLGQVRGTLNALADASQEADGAAFNPATGMIQSAESAPITIYVQSPYNGISAVGNHGDDKYADYPISEVAGNFGKRLNSIHGLQRLLKRATNGRMIVVKLCADAPGDDPDAANEVRWYFTRRLSIGGGESGRVPISYQGPKNWLPVDLGDGRGPLTGLTFTGAGGGNVVDTRAIFAAENFGGDIRGWWRQQESNGSGRDVFFPIPIRKNDATQIWIDAMLTGADLTANVGINNAHNSFVTPAVIISADTSDGSGVLVEGFAPYAAGTRGTTTMAQDSPPEIAFAMRQIHIVRSRWQVTGQCILDRVLLDDNPIFVQGSFGFYSCMAIQLCQFDGTDGYWPVIMNQFSEAIEPCGQPEVFAQPLPVNANPIVPYNGTSLLVHGALQIGLNYMGGRNARLRIPKALSVAPTPLEGSVASQVTVQNPGSMLYIANNGCAYLESSGELPVIWAKQDASVRAPFSVANGRMTIVDGGAGELMVGRDQTATPPITKAALLAGPWNGRLQRAPGDDQSYIIDSAWDTIDTEYNDGK